MAGRCTQDRGTCRVLREGCLREQCQHANGTILLTGIHCDTSLVCSCTTEAAPRGLRIYRRSSYAPFAVRAPCARAHHSYPVVESPADAARGLLAVAADP